MKLKKGFTLIELLVVIAIIGLLSSVVLASLRTARDRSRVTAVKSAMAQLRSQMELNYTDAGGYGAITNGNCATGGFGVATLTPIKDDITKNGGTSLACNADMATGNDTKWSFSVTLPGPGAGSWCIDSSGTVAPNTDSGTADGDCGA